MYDRGLSTRQISDQIEEIYGFDVSESFVSNVTDKILPEIKDWQNRALEETYPVVFIDVVHFSVRDDKIAKKLAAYVVLDINLDGKKEVLGLYIGKNESSKYWLGMLNELKNRGVKDILIVCADGLTGIKESINVAFPEAEYQRCIVHQVRNAVKYISYKEKKEYAKDLKVIYTTNAIESLNSSYKRLNSQRSVFSSDISLLKALYLANKTATKKWSQPIRNWGKVYGEFSIMYPNRLPD